MGSDELSKPSPEEDAINPNDCTQTTRALLNHYFDNLGGTINTLLQSISGGIDWGHAVLPLRTVNPFLAYVIFPCYITFTCFCVLNIITALFMENASRASKNDEEHMLLEEITSRRKWLDDVRRIFAEADADRSGVVTREEFVALASNIRNQQLLKNLGVDVSSGGPNAIFDVVDYDGDGLIDIEEFAKRLSQIHGEARAADLSRSTQET